MCLTSPLPLRTRAFDCSLPPFFSSLELHSPPPHSHVSSLFPNPFFDDRYKILSVSLPQLFPLLFPPHSPFFLLERGSFFVFSTCIAQPARFLLRLSPRLYPSFPCLVGDIGNCFLLPSSYTFSAVPGFPSFPVPLSWFQLPSSFSAEA